MNSATPENIVAGAKMKKENEKAKLEAKESKQNKALKRKLDGNINKIKGLKKAKLNVEAKKTQLQVQN